MVKSLPIPRTAKGDPTSVEVVSAAWIADGDLFVVLNVGFWCDSPRGVDESDAWGILMADMSRHIASAHESKYGRDPRETLQIVRDAFEREILKPTSTHSGKFPKRGPAPE